MPVTMLMMPAMSSVVVAAIIIDIYDFPAHRRFAPVRRQHRSPCRATDCAADDRAVTTAHRRADCCTSCTAQSAAQDSIAIHAGLGRKRQAGKQCQSAHTCKQFHEYALVTKFPIGHVSNFPYPHKLRFVHQPFFHVEQPGRGDEGQGSVALNIGMQGLHNRRIGGRVGLPGNHEIGS